MKEAALFCKKARKKRFLIWDMGFVAATAHGPDSQKFFGSFFQKRTAYLFPSPPKFKAPMRPPGVLRGWAGG
jgi:hypothetical protein